MLVDVIVFGVVLFVAAGATIWHFLVTYPDVFAGGAPSRGSRW